jgi:cell division protein ZapB
MEQVDLQELQQLVNELIAVCQQLAHENQVLRDEKTQLASECESLQEKNTLARTRIEAVIARLKAMEVNS